MKIAAVSEDGLTISQHLGRAPFYVAVAVEDGKITSREQRDKLGHAHFADELHEEAHGSDPRGHGFDPAAQNRHARMAAVIGDCQVLLARGRLTCAAPRTAERKCRRERRGVSKHGAGRRPPDHHRHPCD